MDLVTRRDGFILITETGKDRAGLLMFSRLLNFDSYSEHDAYA